MSELNNRGVGRLGDETKGSPAASVPTGIVSASRTRVEDVEISDRELDALVAEKVMGKEIVSRAEQYLAIQERGGDFFGDNYVATVQCHNETFSKQRPGRQIATVPRYSSDIDSAMEVVEKMRELGGRTQIETCDKPEGKWWVVILMARPERFAHEFAYAETLPRAICEAALSTVGEKED